jgi:predicted nucleic acid-binding protein
LLPSLNNPESALIADASVAINLNATGCAAAILEALPHRIIIVDVVLDELDSGKERGRQDSARVRSLIGSGLIDVVRLEDDGASAIFESLVVGPAAMTLDDGEAATIAFAAAHRHTAVIDERKAIRICTERFPKLTVACTVDLLAHPDVHGGLGDIALADAVFRALYHGRMRVLAHHHDWVIELIGATRASECASLPQSIRSDRGLAQMPVE